MIWLIVGVLVLAMAVVLFFLLRGNGDTPAETPTPTATAIPTATPFGFREIFAAEMPLAGNLEEAIAGQAMGIGEVRTFTVDTIGVPLPAALLSTIDQSEPTYLTLFGKPDGSKGRGFARKINDTVAAASALTAWESTMAQDLSGFLKITPSRAASPNFLNATYQGVGIQYRNFADAFNSIDYAIVDLPDGSHYLVVTNTRDHMFGMIDRAVGAVPGK